MMFKAERHPHRADLASLLLPGFLFLIGAVVIGMTFGSGGARQLFALFSPDSDPRSLQIVLQIRLPRVIVCVVCGAVLAFSGCIFQTILRNDLAEPYILGISGGAAVGYIIALLLGGGAVARAAASFAGGISSSLFVLAFGARQTAKGFLLTGVMLNAFFGALILFLVAAFDSDNIPGMFYWYLGNPGNAELPSAIASLLVCFPIMLFSMRFAHAMDILMLDADIGRSLGINVGKIRITLLLTASFLVSFTVAIAGPIGFVGLVIPQSVRMLFGTEHKILLPGCLLGGSSFLVLCDTAARTLPQNGELPAGVLTSLIGAVIFIVLLWKSSGDAY